MFSFKEKRKKSESRRRRAAAGEFLRMVQESGSTPELIQRVADRRFYMKCCGALTGHKKIRSGEMLRLYTDLEQEARRRGLRFDEIKERLDPVAGVLGLGSARNSREGLQADYYGALGISPGVGGEEVKKAYHRMARQAHPDAPGGDKNRFLAVHEAYEVLADPERRKHYDASRAHAMHLEWSESERPGHHSDPDENSVLAGQVRKMIYLLAAVVAVLVVIAIVADMVVRG